MIDDQVKIGFGGGCHWCTEAVFQIVRGVQQVDQGWISAVKFPSYSEGVIVHFDQSIVRLSTLIDIHIATHSSSSNHNMRSKYRSAIYIFDKNQTISAQNRLHEIAKDYEVEIITEVLEISDFQMNKEPYLNYYKKDPAKSFCANYIEPKLQKMRQEFTSFVQLD